MACAVTKCTRSLTPSLTIVPCKTSTCHTTTCTTACRKNSQRVPQLKWSRARLWRTSRRWRLSTPKPRSRRLLLSSTPWPTRWRTYSRSASLSKWTQIWCTWTCQAWAWQRRWWTSLGGHWDGLSQWFRCTWVRTMATVQRCVLLFSRERMSSPSKKFSGPTSDSWKTSNTRMVLARTTEETSSLRTQ